LRIKILVMVSLAVCSLSVDARALTTKQATCYATNGICYVNCDFGMVVVGGGCRISPDKIGTSWNFPSSSNQWVCKPTAKAGLIEVYAICQ
jgi:hypothetical protein